MAAAVPADVAGQTLTDDQTVSWAKQGGFTGQDLQIAVAVSFTENSSRKIDSISPTNHDGSHDYGEWQINDKAHADLFQQFPDWWTVQNADMAHAVWSSSGWGAWTTYANGDYQKNMMRAAAALGTNVFDPGNVASGAYTQVNALTRIGDAIASVAQGIFKGGAWMANPANWVRVGLIGIGGVIVVGAVIMTTKNQINGDMGGAAAPKPKGSALKSAAKVAVL